MTNEVFEIYNVSYSWTVEDATNLTAAEVNDTLPEYLRFNDNSLIVVLVYSALFVVAAVGNLSVFISLFRSRRRKSRISLMIRHLTIADLMVTFIMIPLEVGWRITVQWLAGNFACKVFLFLRAFGLYLSSNVLVCVSLDRYFAVLHPLRVNDARRRGKMMLAFAWGLSLLCAVPQSIVFHVSSHPKYPFFHQCVSFGLLSQKQEVAYTFFGVFAMYFLPLIVIVVAYTAIMCEIFHKSRDSREPQTNNGRMRLRRSDMTNIERARTRTLKMTIMIVVVFVWCWTPYVVMTLWYMFDWDSAAKVPTSLQDALFMMAVSNSCMNPLVYGSYAIKFPKNCCRCICCCKCQTESALNNGPTLIAEQETRLTRRLIFSVFSLYKAGSTVTRSTAINGGNRSTIVKKCNLLSKKDEKHCMNRPSSIGHISFLSERPTNRSFRSSTFHSDPSPFTGTRKHDLAHHHHSSTHPSSPKEVI